jgi:hypothetical protein
MKKYQDGGAIPQEIQNKLLDREQEKERQAAEARDKAENQAPKKAVKDLYNKVRDMFGVKKENKKAKGGKVGSASKRGDGCATKGKTKGRFV